MIRFRNLHGCTVRGLLRARFCRSHSFFSSTKNSTGLETSTVRRIDSFLRRIEREPLRTSEVKNEIQFLRDEILRSAFSTASKGLSPSTARQIDEFLVRLERKEITASEVRREINFLKSEILSIDNRTLGTKDNPLFLTQSRHGWLGRMAPSLLIIAFLIYLSLRVDKTTNNFDEFGPVADAKEQRERERDRKWPIRIRKSPRRKVKVSRVSFEDVKGNQTAKMELEDVVDFLMNPEKYKSMNVTMPKGVLFTGPPGCGKTLLARALAGEAKVGFLSASGSSFDQMFVGLGALRVRELFKRAREIAPCVIFIDELDALAHRRTGMERSFEKQSLTQLLTEMDGFHQHSGIVIVGSTNMPGILDKALTRSGRFDRTVRISYPDRAARAQIIELYLKDKPKDKDLDIDRLSAETTGLSGADLSNIVNLAGIEAVKKGQKKITMTQLREAKDIVVMGRKNEQMTLSPIWSQETKKLTAFHECGHALVAMLTPGAHPVDKVTLLPRGNSLGHTSLIPPEQFEHMQTKKQLLAMIDTAMGGRAAEEVNFGEDNITGGASNDFQNATQIAQQMVGTMGMSKIGKVYRSPDQKVALGVPPGGGTTYDDQVDEEVNRLLNESYERVKKLLVDNEALLGRMVEKLLVKETLTHQEILEIKKSYR